MSCSKIEETKTKSGKISAEEATSKSRPFGAEGVFA
jgi:hypothetical protein